MRCEDSDERRPSTDWGMQQQEFLVALEARDAADAIRRVELALQGQGTYRNFFANLLTRADA